MPEVKAPARKTAPRKVKLTPPEPKAPAPKKTAAAKKTAAPRSTSRKYGDPKIWRPAPAGGRYYGGSSTPAPAKKAAAKKTAAAPAKKAAAKKAESSGVKKAAAAEVAGGGPEDPLADAAAAGSLLSGLKSGGKKAAAAAPSPGGSFAANPRRTVLAEFLVCFLVLGLGTIVAPSGRANGGAAHIAVKGSALALLFFILALMTGGGAKAAKTAEALGALVTVAYLFTSQDAASLVTWLSKFFSPAAEQAGEAVGAGGDAVAKEVEGTAQ